MSVQNVSLPLMAGNPAVAITLAALQILQVSGLAHDGCGLALR